MKIYKNVSLKDKNWFKTGGNAKFFCQTQNEKEFKEALEFSCKNKLEIFVLGEGANVLISDEGFDGLVINPKSTQISILDKDKLPEKYPKIDVLNPNEELVLAETGTKMKDLINFCLDKNLINLEEFSGIPGTVGGSIFINIHHFEFFLAPFLFAAQIINKKTLEVSWVKPPWFKFGYDSSRLQKERHFLLASIFKLKKVSLLQASYAKGRRDEMIRQRNKKYPISNTCGSFFRNFYENEITQKTGNKKIIYAAYYLDKIGVKGVLKEGGAIVSHRHANMLVNQNNATTNDIINLARQMQLLVYNNFRIILQPECRLIGFKKYPLLSFKPHHSKLQFDIAT